MSDQSRPARVGIRELRQNLSIYVDRVREGETLEVTEHGQPVARLGPLPAPTGVYDRLVAEGKLTSARERLDTLPPPIQPLAGSEALSETLRRLREQERY